VIALAERGLGADPVGYRREFVALARRTAELGQVAGGDGEEREGVVGDQVENSLAGATRHSPAPRT